MSKEKIFALLSAQAGDFVSGEDISAQEADALAAKYPDKTVLWDVPLSGGSRPSSAESLSLSSPVSYTHLRAHETL